MSLISLLQKSNNSKEGEQQVRAEVHANSSTSKKGAPERTAGVVPTTLKVAVMLLAYPGDQF